MSKTNQNMVLIFGCFVSLLLNAIGGLHRWFYYPPPQKKKDIQVTVIIARIKIKWFEKSLGNFFCVLWLSGDHNLIRPILPKSESGILVFAMKTLIYPKHAWRLNPLEASLPQTLGS